MAEKPMPNHVKKDIEESKGDDSPPARKLDRKAILKAKSDLQKILGRKPSPAEVSKFLHKSQALKDQDVVEATSRSPDEKIPDKAAWNQVDQGAVNKAHRDLQEKLGREPNDQEVEEFLAAMPNIPQTNDVWQQIDDGFVDKAIEKLNKDLGREPSAKEISDYLSGQSPQDHPVVVPDPEEVAEQMDPEEKKLVQGTNQQNVQKVDPADVKAAQVELKKTLGRQPTPEEVQKYLQDKDQEENGTTSKKAGAKGIEQVSPQLVKDIQEDLKSVLGREPTPKEVQEFLQDLNSEEQEDDSDLVNQGTHVEKNRPVDENVKAEAKADLEELLGRPPTQQELDSFLHDVQDNDPVSEEELRKASFDDNSFERNEAYNSLDAMKAFQSLGYMNPTDQQINDWLYEHNQDFIGRFDDLPGITWTYGNAHPVEYQGYFSNTNIFILFLVLVLGALFYKQRKKNKYCDDFVKTDDDKGIMEQLFNPFNRKKDKDDDFDKVL